MPLSVVVEVLAALVFVFNGLFSLLVVLWLALKETRSGRASGCGGRPLRTVDETLPNTWYDEMAPLLASPCRLPVVISGALQVLFNLVGTTAMFLVFRTLAMDDVWWQIMILAWLASNILQAAATILFYGFYALTPAAVVACGGWAAVVLTAVAAFALQRYVAFGLALIGVAWTTFYIITVDGWMAARRCCCLPRVHVHATAGYDDETEAAHIPIDPDVRDIPMATYDFLTRV